MQFGSVDGFLYVARITGPTHNLLQLRLSKAAVSFVICEELRATGGCKHEKLDRAKIEDSVRVGVTSANAAFGTELHPTHIRFVANDTGPEDVYRLLAEAIVSKVAAGELVVE